MTAHRQAQTAQTKLKLDLFERRSLVFETVRDVTAPRPWTSDYDLDRYFAEIQAARWLFDQEMDKWLRDEVWKKLCQLQALNVQLRDLHENQNVEQDDDRKERIELHRWLNEQRSQLHQRFTPFMTIDAQVGVSK